MKVAFSASGKNLSDLVDPRFGRCLFFAVVDTDSMALTVYSNESSGLRGSAGIQAVQFLADMGVSAVITGHCGPNASLSLQRAGIKLYEGQGGISIDQVLNKLADGALTATGDGSALFYSRFCEEKEGASFGGGRLRRCDSLEQKGRPIKQTKTAFQRKRARHIGAQGMNRTERR